MINKIKDFKCLLKRTQDIEQKLNKVNERLSSPTFKLKILQTGIKTRLELRLFVLKEAETNMLKTSVLLRLLRTFKLV